MPNTLAMFRRCRALLCASCGTGSGHHGGGIHRHGVLAAPPASLVSSAGPMVAPTSPAAPPADAHHHHPPTTRRIHTAPYPINSELLMMPENRVATGQVDFKSQFPSYSQLKVNNQYWVHRKNSRDPHYFNWLSKGQKPPYLYIGCSDSRLDLNELVGVKPGGMFVYRNIANQVNVTDMGLLATLSFAIEELGVEHIIVCGHYECGGVKAAIKMETENTLVANFVNPIKRIYTDNKEELSALDEKTRVNRLAELSVMHQVHNLCKTSVLRSAFKKGKYPQLHGWVVDIYNGRVIDMPIPVDEWTNRGYLPTCYCQRFPQPHSESMCGCHGGAAVPKVTAVAH